MKQLKVSRLPDDILAYEFHGAFDPKAIAGPWAELEEADISDYPWLSAYPDRFQAGARMGYNRNGLQVLMYACESPILSLETRFGGMPCLDSCMEFFFSPFPDRDDRYINIEINPSGIAHVAVGIRGKRYVYDREVPGMVIRTARYDGGVWAISFNVPESFLYTHFADFPASGAVIKGNFYKCSGGGLHEHYGTWAHVGTERPDFHRPEYFGDLVLE